MTTSISSERTIALQFDGISRMLFCFVNLICRTSYFVWCFHHITTGFFTILTSENHIGFWDIGLVKGSEMKGEDAGWGWAVAWVVLAIVLSECTWLAGCLLSLRQRSVFIRAITATWSSSISVLSPCERWISGLRVWDHPEICNCSSRINVQCHGSRWRIVVA